MTRISSHTNVHNTCLRLLRRMGYVLEMGADLDEEEFIIPESMWWTAYQGGVMLNASNPIELLGLAHVHQAAPSTPDTPYWWTTPGPNISEELFDRRFPSEEE